jgi:hypothetical protein
VPSTVTEPLPVPVRLRVYSIWAKLAVTFLLPSMVTVSGLAPPVTSPDQHEKL